MSQDNVELHEAIENTDISAIKEMIEKNDVTYEIALVCSIEKDNVETLNYLLKDSNKDLNMIVENTGLTMIHIAAQNGSFNCARFLISKGALPNSLDSTGRI